MIELTREPIDAGALAEGLQSPEAGAVVLFLGVTREWTGGKQTERLAYECYQTMAESKLRELEAAARQRWQLVECRLVHRLGEVPAGQASVAVAVSSAHRPAAFEAGRWLIDELKRVVPIWKQENYADGTREWVHPGADA